MSSFIDPIGQFLILGGPVVWLLLLMSCTALTLFLLKLWQLTTLSRSNKGQLGMAIQAWKRQDQQQAISLLNNKHPFDRIAGQAMRALMHSPERGAQIREDCERQALGLLAQLRQYLRPMEVIANLSPLLGLLGTVLGMVVAFQQMEAAGSQVDPSVLSGGIWQALLTTAVGIAVAIPVISMHSWLESKVEQISHQLNDALTQVFTGFQATHGQQGQQNRHAA